MTKMFAPKVKTPSPAPAPAAPKIEKPQRELGDEADSQELRKKRGRNALRIDPQTGGVAGGGGQGINVPMK